jgi:hypothetical protein
MPRKPALQPLLAPGRHSMTIAYLRVLTVDRFTSSNRRPLIFADLERLTNYLETQSVICELWVDGSFLTEKEEADDADLTVSAFISDLELLDATLQNWILTTLNGNKKYSPLLDTYICVRFPRDDPRRAADKSDYWAEKWGVGWDDRLTGFAVIKLGETDVGHRLCA